jgi:putative transcriptional regulator
MTELGREIKRLREEKGWTQAQLAVYAGSSQPTVNLLESGRRNPSTDTLQKLAKALEVEVGDFFPKAQAPLSFENLTDEEARKKEVKQERLEYRLDNTLAEKLEQQLDEQLRILSEKTDKAKFDEDLYIAANDFHNWWLNSFDWLHVFLQLYPENQWPQLEEVVNKASRDVEDKVPKDPPRGLRDMAEVMQGWSARQDAGV